MGFSQRNDNIRVIARPFFVKFKKHNCSKCSGQLKITWITQWIMFGTPEANKNVRFGEQIGMAHIPMKYSFAIFECKKCDNKLSIHDQYFIENPHKKNKRKYDAYHQYLATIARYGEYDKYLQHQEYLRSRAKYK